MTTVHVFGELMHDARQAAGISQRALADRSGISLATVRDLEQRRTRRPRQAVVEAIVAALGLAGDRAAALRRAAVPPLPAAAAAPVGGPVRVGILGSVTVRRGSEEIPVGRSSRRAVLGRLALSAGVPVPVDRLVDLLWEDPPKAPADALYTNVSRLRRALHPDASITRTPAGYRLDLTDEQFDLAEYRHLVRLAESAPVTEALGLLESAAALWRGELLADVPQLAGDPAAVAIAEERVTTVLRLADVAITVGEPARALPALRALSAAEPLHEPVHARLMEVLSAAGRQAEALAAYTVIRDRLSDELGMSPGAALAGAHVRVLRREAAGPRDAGAPAPAQLPAAPQLFTGRADALAALDAVLDDPAASVAVIWGTAGVGKTTTAIHWAHRVREGFRDGQLYVNLRGFHPTAQPLTPGEALRGFLSSLGVPAARVPVDLDAQTGLLRTLLAGRRVLMLLDNARDAEQVRPLLPGTAGCVTLITSRSRLTGLVVTDDARPVPLDLLTGGEAEQLLAQRLGADRVAAEPEAVRVMAEGCARLPLALAIAAARATTRPAATLAGLAAELRGGDRLGPLSTGEPGTDVRAVFDCSYRNLTPAAARLFRLAGLHPGPDLDAAAAAGLAGERVMTVVPLLAELSSAHLLAETRPGRYAAHDLLQAYAAGRARAEETPAAREAAFTGLADHLITTTRAAVSAISRGEPDAGPTGGFAGPADGRAWLDAERANLVALARHGRPEHTVAVAATAYRYFEGGHHAEAYQLHSLALEAARRLGDARAEAVAAFHLAVTCRRGGDYAEALALLEGALVLRRAVGDRAGEGWALVERGVSHWRLGDYDRARADHRAALEVFLAVGDRVGEANQLVMWAIGDRQVGDFTGSAEGLRRALGLYEELGHPLGVAHTLNRLGQTEHAAGDHRQALRHHSRALTLFRELGNRPGEAAALDSLGHALRAAGLPGEAADRHRQALAIYREIGEHSVVVEAINGLAAALNAGGDADGARAAFTDALRRAEQAGDRHEQARAHDGLALVYAGTGDEVMADRHRRTAKHLYSGLGLG
ncbi:XRE family transcriptional regulator [Actinoplanes italicus]|uniref:DNA-binding SARP family transcriptional activator n=1 Tax=Actinoplanes italicus TaxID=113567 RepID=A0A2T0K952_9ACTN|nr:tetratricopeptide repeat protein [Actinoplanes italicus]PRX19581.1 DNA-binding SARP family transcriptional activator [Actinoplanes italicus]GIE30408.1 XRE family transcriptional regulator [Actinoplanes italicus]